MEKIFEYLKNNVVDKDIADYMSLVDERILYQRFVGGKITDCYNIVDRINETLSHIGLVLIDVLFINNSIQGDIEFTDSRYVKQVILVRKDLKMRRGKEIAQSCHASLGVIYSIEQKEQREEQLYYFLWKKHSFTKIALVVNSEEELVDAYNKAIAKDIPASLITDSGRTEFKGVPTKTCVGIGPFWSHEIDTITRHLTLY